MSPCRTRSATSARVSASALLEEQARAGSWPPRALDLRVVALHPRTFDDSGFANHITRHACSEDRAGAATWPSTSLWQLPEHLSIRRFETLSASPLAAAMLALKVSKRRMLRCSGNCHNDVLGQVAAPARSSEQVWRVI